MARGDLTLREDLTRDGSLFQGYHPRMEALHQRHATRLAALIDAHGWPGRSRVGRDGARAAWLILQHAIGNPPLMRRGLTLLRGGVREGEVSALEVAMLEDRIRTFEGRPQRYGTQFDWDEHGRLSPLPLEDPAGAGDTRGAPAGRLGRAAARHGNVAAPGRVAGLRWGSGMTYCNIGAIRRNSSSLSVPIAGRRCSSTMRPRRGISSFW